MAFKIGSNTAIFANNTLNVANVYFTEVITTSGSWTPNPSFSVQGSNYGYFYGGLLYPTPGTPFLDYPLEAINFSSDVRSTISQFSPPPAPAPRFSLGNNKFGGVSSATHAYWFGPGGAIRWAFNGTGPVALAPPATVYHNPSPASLNFTAAVTESNRISLGNLTSFPDGNDGFVFGGPAGFGTSTSAAKFPFSSTGVFSLISPIYGLQNRFEQGRGYSSIQTGAGYAVGLESAFASLTNVWRFPFANFSGYSNSADLTSAFFHRRFGNCSDTTHGYMAGDTNYNDSFPTFTARTVMQRFSFTLGVSSLEIGDLAEAVAYTSQGSQSTTHGYIAGGFGPTNPDPLKTPPARGVTTIQKFPFAATSNATDIGDLTGGPAGFAQNGMTKAAQY
jgi:hypothetical protein